jgi:hypothetical protein
MNLQMNSLIPQISLCVLLSSLPFGARCFAAEDSIEVVFDKAPIERGLSFDRSNVRATTVKLGNVESPAWVADSSIEPSMGWMRSFRFKVTDPKFQKGNRPSVDVEVTYHMPGGNGWSLKADAREGGRQFGGGGGNTNNWRTEKIRLDGAFFGARDHKSTDKLAVDGFDLRLDAVNSSFFLKSIKITGYDPKENVDWARMLKTERPQAQTPGAIFAFGRAARHEINVPLQNMAQIARPLFYRFDVAGYDDKTRHTSSGQISLPASSTQPLKLAFDNRTWPLGPYDARLSLFLKQGDAAPVYTRNIRLGVVSDTVLPKAREGEFLFGLDAANTYIFDTQSPNGFAFYRLMGVDILRDLHRKNDGPQDVEAIGRSLERLKAEKLRGMLMFDPPRDTDEARRVAETAKYAARLREIARRFAGRGPGQIQFWELGNEPDLKGFYPGTMQQYAASFAEMRAAVKAGAAEKGLKPEDTIVLNGGLSFAGPEGESRSREFLKLIDNGFLDAIAYHGHGKGGESERENLNRVRDAAQKGGKTATRFVETESGFSGNDRNGLMEQARTTVEKLSYAQSQRMETFMFFRLFMEGQGSEGGYGMSDHQHEPRPSALAYRHIVERLRHHAFVKEVGFARALDAPEIQAHLFEERDAQSKPTGRKTLVAWSENPSKFDLSLRLDARNGRVSSAQNYDLFGNASPTKTVAGNIATVSVGIEPIFVSWRSSGASTLVDVAPSLLTVRAEPLLVGATTRIPVLARNPDARAQAAEIRVQPFARLPIKATANPARVTLRADGEPVSSQISVALDASDLPLALPTWWKVFTDIDVSKLAPESFTSIPQSVAGAQNPVAGQFVASQDFAGGSRLEIARLAGGFGEKRAALAVSILDAPRDMILPVAASADWYMQWRVNGREVYNTLERGNAHGGLADHLFELPLKKGRNILSALVLSGSGGWKLEFGGPKERALAVSAGTDPDRLVVSLVVGGKTLSTQVVPLQIGAPIPTLGGALPTSLDAWMPLQPLAVLGSADVTNFFVKEPEQARWYKGEQDLSALTWLRHDAQNLHLFVAATDDQLVEAANAQGLPKADGLRVSMRGEGGQVLAEATAGLIGGQSVSTGNAGIKATVTREGARTLCALTIPRALVGKSPFRLSLSLSDNDSNFLKQQIDLGGSKGLRLIVP